MDTKEKVRSMISAEKIIEEYDKVSYQSIKSGTYKIENYPDRFKYLKTQRIKINRILRRIKIKFPDLRYRTVKRHKLNDEEKQIYDGRLKLFTVLYFINRLELRLEKEKKDNFDGRFIWFGEPEHLFELYNKLIEYKLIEASTKRKVFLENFIYENNPSKNLPVCKPIKMCYKKTVMELLINCLVNGGIIRATKTGRGRKDFVAEFYGGEGIAVINPSKIWLRFCWVFKDMYDDELDYDLEHFNPNDIRLDYDHYYAIERIINSVKNVEIPEF